LIFNAWWETRSKGKYATSDVLRDVKRPFADQSNRVDAPFYAPDNAMSKPGLRAAILVVSTTASRDPSNDISGGILKNVFEQEGAGQWTVVETKIVSDVAIDIQRAVTQWTDQESPVNLIVTTGGTGFATFDNTPEACSMMILGRA